MSFTRVHSVTLVVRDLAEARRVYCDAMGLAVDEDRTPLPNGAELSGKGRYLAIPVAETWIEIVQPSSPEGEYGRFLAAAGGVGGMHHISLESDDLTGDIARLQSRGIATAEAWDRRSAVLLDSSRTLGLNIEVRPVDSHYPHPQFRGTGAVTGLGHVGIAARDPAATHQLFHEGLGLPLDPRTPLPWGRHVSLDNVGILEFPVGGTIIEVSHPKDETSGTARFVASRAKLGAAYHHICPWAPDVHAFIDRAVAAGLQQIGQLPPREKGPRATGWIHPRSALGVLIEVWNRPR